MAKDDYFVIIYQILKYLYECLKVGKQPEKVFLTAENFDISEEYWLYVMKHLLKEDYVEGINIVESDQGLILASCKNATITPKGIEYLFDNTLLQKAKKVLTDIKGAIPGI